ncbi:MAG: glycosyltransferase family 2 protein [Lachnospiraceae bacterium]|nr:glycosyltransferase family 2 protein [Lachnospiraceae bacterium]
MKQICIIMAVYNGENYLAEQIDSILKNSCQNFTLHIFNDHSRDRSQTIIEEYVRRYPGKIIGHHHQENHGVIRNFLEGSQIMDADYYMFCDQDDVWLPDKIRRSLDAIEQLESQDNNQPCLVFGDAKMVDQTLRETAPSFQRQSGYHTDALDPAHILMENKLIGCTILFNRPFQQILTVFPPEIRMHDWWIALIGSFFGKIQYLDEPLLLYRQHGNNVVGGTSFLSYVRNRLSHLQKQREALYATCAQAAAFLRVYQDKLSPEQTRLLQQFATLPKANWFARRYRILRYHFFKSGMIRNIGVLCII